MYTGEGMYEYCIVSAQQFPGQVHTTDPDGVPSVLILPIPEAFSNLSMFIGRPSYITSPVKLTKYKYSSSNVTRYLLTCLQLLICVGMFEPDRR